MILRFMIEFNLQEKLLTKRYLKNLKRYDFNTPYELVMELFRNLDFEDQEVEELILDLLKSMGGPRVGCIPPTDLKIASEYYHQLMEQSKLNFDPEKAGLLFLSAMNVGQLSLIIDDRVLKTTDVRIKLFDQSVITIIDHQKINSIKFNSL